MEKFFIYLSEQPWILVGLIFLLQAWVVGVTFKNLYKFKRAWSDIRWNSDTDSDGLVLLDDSAEMSQNCRDFVSEVNKYIRSHNGAVEYGIIKDKYENAVGAEYEYAVSKMQFPTYIGLLGTFIGVYIGLKCFSIGLAGTDSTVTEDMIRELVGGIIISMLTSVIGLILMMISNGFAGSVRKSADKSQEEFLQFIQTDVLPSLGTNVTSSLNRLQNTIREFEPSFRSVIDDFKTAFAECTDMFKGTFANNVAVLTAAVDKMGANMTLINENIEKQDRLLSTLQQHSLVDTLDKFVSAAESFGSVSDAVSKLEEVRDRIVSSSSALIERQAEYNRSLAVPEELLGRINALLNRVVTFERSLNEFGENMNQTQLFRNEQLNLIEEQLKALQAKTRAVTDYQDTQVAELSEIYKEQNAAIAKLTIAFRSAVEQNGTDMEKTLTEFKSLYETIVSECRRGVEQKLDEFTAALGRSLDFVDAGKKLDNLGKLQSIEDGMNGLRASGESSLAEISSTLHAMNARLDSIGRRPVPSGSGNTVSPSKKENVFSRIFKRNRKK